MINFKNRVSGACLAALMACAMLAGSPATYAQTTPANLSPDLTEIVKFAQAHMSDDVILAYIKNSGKVYSLSGDDMIYLNTQGVSQPVLSALLATKNNVPTSAPAPSPAPSQTAPPGFSQQPAYAPSPAPAPAPAYAPPGIMDSFNMDGALNPSVWMMQTPLLQNLAQWNGSVLMPPMLGFSPAGMQMSGVNGPGQFTGVQSVASYAAPFTLTATVTAVGSEGIPFEMYLVSPDLRQWLDVAGHLGGAGGEPHGGFAIRTPFGGVRAPFGGGPSPEHGIWANWTGGQPLSSLGTKINPAPIPGVPYTITMTVGPDGMASVTVQDPSGAAVGGMNSLPVGPGPFNVVLAARRNGPTFANWQSVQLTTAGGPPAQAAMTEPPQTPTFDYFQSHLTPYGQWVDVPDAGTAWVPSEANNPDWRPYMDAGHWEYTDAGWYWQSDYPWGDIAFHYGRWIRNGFTSGRWAWVPAYNWAPSWVAWREGEGGFGWAPLPWGVDYRVGLGLYWHGGLLVDGGIGLGLGFDAYIFVGSDHFWGGDYHRYAFDRSRSRAFYEHSEFHAGYRMEGGHFRAEGLGRDHIALVTHHEVMEHRASEMRHTEERHDFARRTEEHHDLARAGRPEARPGERPENHMESRPGERPENHTEARPGEASHGGSGSQHGFGETPSHPGTTTHGTSPVRPGSSGSKSSGSEKKPNR